MREEGCVQECCIPANNTTTSTKVMDEQCSSCDSSSYDEEFLLLCLQDEESKTRRSEWVHPINRKREELGEFHHLFPDLMLDDERFFQYFRMSYENFCDLHNLLQLHIRKKHTRCRRPISTEERLAVCLRYLSTGDTFRTITFSYRLGRKTVADIVYEVCMAMWNVLQPIVMATPTSNDWSAIASEFQRQWQFPNCIGALDGKHVEQEKPANSGSLFYNYKKTFSIVLLALVDANYKFIAVDVGAYGKLSDAGIFKTSAFGKRFNKNQLDIPPDKILPGTDVAAPYVIVADSAFPLNRNLMKPYPENKIVGHENRQVFNYRLSRARRVSENAFGILAKRFRLYQRKLQLSTTNLDTVVLATCVLHNYLRIHNCPALEARYLLDEAADEPPQGLRPVQGVGGSSSSVGMTVRQMYTAYFNSPSGEVGWQYKRVRAGRLLQ